MGGKSNCSLLEIQEKFELLPASVQFSVLVGGVFLFFGVHNLLQEAIMIMFENKFGIMLGFFEVLGVAICSFWERHYVAQERGRVAPISAYPLLTACLLASSALSNLSINYINYPTKVIFRSCKLIPTMIIASVVHKKVFSIVEYCCAVAISLGLVFFAAADWELAPSFHPVGLILVSLSVCADAILPNTQERLFRQGSSRLEVTLYTNIFTLAAMTLITLISGDMLGSFSLIHGNSKLASYIAIYTFIAYFAISMHMNIVKRYGGVTAVLVATGRKGMTLILSFLIFPKQFSWLYPAGAILVLSGLLFSSLFKMQKDEKRNPDDRSLKQHSSDVETLQPFLQR